jgi:hypothetical protein
MEVSNDSHSWAALCAMAWKTDRMSVGEPGDHLQDLRGRRLPLQRLTQGACDLRI